MIYIITPKLYDFKETCMRFGVKVEYNKFNGMPLKGDVRWIQSLDGLFGRSIGKNDQVIYGNLFYKLKLSVQKQYMDEIAIRRAYSE